MISEKVLEHLTITAEACGANLSSAAIEIMLHDLADYPEQSVLAALADCRKTLSGRFTLAAVIERIKGQDGRPGAEEAWAMLPKGEDDSVAWTAEMRFAWGIAEPLIAEGDKIGARMAFKEAYTRRVEEARANGVPAQWEVSLGHDPHKRDAALQKAVAAGYIGQDHAKRLLVNNSMGAVGALLLGNSTPLLEAQETPVDREAAEKNLMRLKAIIQGKQVVKDMPEQ